LALNKFLLDFRHVARFQTRGQMHLGAKIYFISPSSHKLGGPNYIWKEHRPVISELKYIFDFQHGALFQNQSNWKETRPKSRSNFGLSLCKN